MESLLEVKVGYVQFSPLFGEVRLNVETALSMLDGCSAHLMVLPELFSSGYLFLSKEEVVAVAEEIPGGATTQALMEYAARRKMFIAAGIAERDGDALFNSAVLVGPGGYLARYRKVHLFHEEKLYFEPGNLPFEVVDIGIAKVGLLICFDWYYPEATRTLALKGMEVLCHCANLVLPHCPAAMITRALENRIFTVTANRTGVEERGVKSYTYIGQSQVVSPMGEIIARAPKSGDAADVVSILPALARSKKVLDMNHLFDDRRPGFYIH